MNVLSCEGSTEEMLLGIFSVQLLHSSNRYDIISPSFHVTEARHSLWLNQSTGSGTFLEMRIRRCPKTSNSDSLGVALMVCGWLRVLCETILIGSIIPRFIIIAYLSGPVIQLYLMAS
ncbi:hypothetical protein AVEN_154955-1 [Araneus ventricosus]|uniref:Uncharacterized protein n=1 Tax=Araneus ventricosus TaxID=182803 RepID=A0A4Y2A7G7_ARAVE|nr:hypothetical protein AVEN_154955-1 [Araneus ventricosus]